MGGVLSTDQTKQEHHEKPHTEKSHTEEPRTEKSHTEKSHTEKSHTEKPHTEKPHHEKPHTEKPHTEKQEHSFKIETKDGEVKAGTPVTFVVRFLVKGENLTEGDIISYFRSPMFRDRFNAGAAPIKGWTILSHKPAEIHLSPVKIALKKRDVKRVNYSQENGEASIIVQTHIQTGGVETMNKQVAPKIPGYEIKIPDQIKLHHLLQGTMAGVLHEFSKAKTELRGRTGEIKPATVSAIHEVKEYQVLS